MSAGPDRSWLDPALGAPPTPRVTTLLRRGLTRRCAVCGQGGLFQRWFSMLERCPRCEFRFERREGQFIGAIGVNTVVSFGLLIVTLAIAIIASYPEVDAAPLLVPTVAVAVVAPTVFFPFSKTLWNAIDLALSPLELGEAPALDRRLGSVEGPGKKSGAGADV